MLHYMETFRSNGDTNTKQLLLRARIDGIHRIFVFFYEFVLEGFTVYTIYIF